MKCFGFFLCVFFPVSFMLGHSGRKSKGTNVILAIHFYFELTYISGKVIFICHLVIIGVN